ncbi:hypothetical protein [Trinickia sp. LjRoot230]|uniref:hypothetical protein n=1 Tax=Trinickia sp. LjRoot230 TaxID=3342288 RepID=UPI003F4F8F45
MNAACLGFEFPLSTLTRRVCEQGRIDVVMQNAGHLVVGPVEAFTPEDVFACRAE